VPGLPPRDSRADVCLPCCRRPYQDLHSVGRHGHLRRRLGLGQRPRHGPGLCQGRWLLLPRHLDSQHGRARRDRLRRRLDPQPRRQAGRADCPATRSQPALQPRALIADQPLSCTSTINSSPSFHSLCLPLRARRLHLPLRAPVACLPPSSPYPLISPPPPSSLANGLPPAPLASQDLDHAHVHLHLIPLVASPSLLSLGRPSLAQVPPSFPHSLPSSILYRSLLLEPMPACSSPSLLRR